jgi:hypothetical protein
MTPYRSQTQNRRRPLFRIEPEALEGRLLLTGGGGNTIALAKGTIAAVDGTTTSPFVIESGHFSVPNHRMTLGVDVVADTGSTILPKINSVALQSGVRIATTALPQPKKNASATTTDSPHAVLATITVPAGKKGFSTNFNTKISAQNKTSGDYLLGYYLPGDADGDGAVSKADVATIKSLLGKTVSDAAYSFDADSNRDGRITMADVNIAKANLGVKTTITPSFTANLDPNTDTGALDRITNDSTVNFNGSGSPGAKITFTEVNNKEPAVSTVVNSSGVYTVTIPLQEGTSTFTVTSVDAFGQTITGSIQPVTYTTGAVPPATS